MNHLLCAAAYTVIGKPIKQRHLKLLLFPFHIYMHCSDLEITGLASYMTELSICPKSCPKSDSHGYTIFKALGFEHFKNCRPKAFNFTPQY